MTGSYDASPVFASLTTYHGSRLACEISTGRIVAAADTADVCPVLLCQLPASPGIGFVVADVSQPIALMLSGDSLVSVALSLRVVPAPVPGRCSLRRPIGRNSYLCSIPATPGCAEELSLCRDKIGAWEEFVLEAVAPTSVASTVHDLVATLAIGLRRGLTGRSFLALLEEDDQKLDGLIESIGRLLPYEDQRWLGTQLLRSRKARGRLARAVPGDLWAREALPSLAAWLEERDIEQPRLRRIEPDIDPIAQRLLEAASTGLALSCTLGARRGVAPRRDVCVLTTVRNEGIYLLDWIAYHRSIGVEGIFIYSNDNDDGSDELLAQLARHGAITWVDNQVAASVSPQFKAYGHALCVMPDLLDYRWTLAIDLDEFFGFDTTRFRSIGDYIHWQEARPVDAIAVCWQLVSPAKQIFWRDVPVWTRFEKYQELPSRMLVKTLFRTARFRHSWCHDPVPSFDDAFHYRDSEGEVHNPSGRAETIAVCENPRIGSAWIAHFYARSAEEFLWKKARRTGDQPVGADGNDVDLASAATAAALEAYCHLQEDTNSITDQRLQLCAASTLDEKARLLELPGVAEIDERIKVTFRTMSRDVLKRANDVALRQRTDSAMARFLRLFASDGGVVSPARRAS